MKNKILLTLAIVVALLSLITQKASAASLASPSTVSASMGTTTTSDFNTNYNFIIGSDGIFVNDSEYNTTDEYQLFVTTSYASGIMQVSFDTGIITEAQFTSSNLGKCDGISLTLTPTFTGTLNYEDSGLDVMYKTLVSVTPYVLVDGIKYTLANGSENQVFPDEITHLDMEYYFGADIDVIISYDASTNTLYDVKSTFGTAKLNLNVPAFDIEVTGYKHVSTGDQLITDAVIDWGSQTVDAIYLIGEAVIADIDANSNAITQTLIESNNLVLSSIGNFSTLVSNSFNMLYKYMESECSNTAYACAYLFSIKELVTEYFPVFDATMDNILITSENIYNQFVTFRKEFSDFGLNLTTLLTEHHNSLSDKLEEIKNTLTKGYDTTDSDSVSGKIEESMKVTESTDKVLTDNAIDTLDGFTVPSDGLAGYGPQFLRAITLCSGMLQSIYESLGEYSSVVSILFTITIATMLIGMFRFFKG